MKTLLPYSPIQNIRSLTGKKWLPPCLRSASNLVRTLAEVRGIDLSTNASWTQLTDPMQLGEMQRAVERIYTAMEHKECIGIIGDYDADGITGVAQLVRFFRRHGVEPHVILPHRQRDGYGIKTAFIHNLQKKGVTLLITVDTGISHAAEIADARSCGMDGIVTDHHTLHDELPDAIILHPKILKEHQNPFLCGSGVIFTLIRALENDVWEEKDIDLALATIGTIADVVPLLGENRTIVQLGLQAMNARLSPNESTPRMQDGRTENQIPIFDLARSVVKERETITSTHIGFRLAPRINASGRLADPMIALRGLLDGGEELERLHTLNAERQEATQRMMEIAEAMVGDTPILMLRSPAFHAGIIGLIAGRLTEKTGKLSVVGCEEGERITCSLRSPPQYNIAEALTRCHKYLESFGGHREAGGCTLNRKHWEPFCKAMEQDRAKHYSSVDLAPAITIDAELRATDISLQRIRALAVLEPYGAGNPEPKFLLRGQGIQAVRQVGAGGRHLQCSIGGIKAIGFGLGDLAQRLPDRCDVVCTLGIDSWNGYEKVQLMLIDIAESQKSPMDSVDSSTGIEYYLS